MADERRGDVIALAGRVLLLALLVFWTVRFVTARSAEVTSGSFLHVINLVFHEAGHLVFSPFGTFMSALGGSLMQVLVPVICAVALYRQADDPFGAAAGAWWAGQNLVDLAPYIADARALQLPLLGGATGAEVEGHDWEAILQSLGWLHHDRALGDAAHVAGSIVMIGALAAAAWLLTARRQG
jgi:hypothetical protein